MGVSSGCRRWSRWSPLRRASLNYYAFWCHRRVKTEVITKRWPVIWGMLFGILVVAVATLPLCDLRVSALNCPPRRIPIATKLALVAAAKARLKTPSP